MFRCSGSTNFPESHLVVNVSKSFRSCFSAVGLRNLTYSLIKSDGFLENDRGCDQERNELNRKSISMYFLNHILFYKLSL